MCKIENKKQDGHVHNHFKGSGYRDTTIVSLISDIRDMTVMFVTLTSSFFSYSVLGSGRHAVEMKAGTWHLIVIDRRIRLQYSVPSQLVRRLLKC